MRKLKRDPTNQRHIDAYGNRFAYQVLFAIREGVNRTHVKK